MVVIIIWRDNKGPVLSRVLPSVPELAPQTGQLMEDPEGEVLYTSSSSRWPHYPSVPTVTYVQ